MSELSIIISAAGLLIVYTGTVIGIVLWFVANFRASDKAIGERITIHDYAAAHENLVGRVYTLEIWAIRNNGHLPVDFNSISAPDRRVTDR